MAEKTKSAKENTLKRDTGVDEILPCLYLSNRFKASCKNILEAYDIKTVLTVMERPMEEEKRLGHITYEFVEMDDECSHDMLSNMANFNEIIHRGLQKGHMLVHCLAGVSRSVTAIASYLIATLGFSAPQAVCIIREGRPRAGPNDGFCNQLTVFEKRVQREKGGRVVTENPLANRQIEQTLEESEKFSNFSLVRRIIHEKQEKGPLKFGKPGSEFTVHCRQCEKLLLEWDDVMFHDPSSHLIPRETAPCNSYFTVWDTVMKNRGALNFSSRLNEESKDQKWLACVECKAEVGEADAWYGVICACETLIVPGYQIIKDRVTVKEKVPIKGSV
ncbi:dual specificity protein phosphatase 12-like isoform X2 [Bolinopsis microptera]|uniref:dual specificity protein phosphatase 12-like isoform X2 n=1 Tax=Bolinopsis microptera TaxID=2820187 RepID=UPI003078B0A3